MKVSIGILSWISLGGLVSAYLDRVRAAQPVGANLSPGRGLDPEFPRAKK